ncbi:MAG: asparagine synthase (glutamine-hydrolyzing) [Candidatus Peregrinibacteria bacterium]|nr:asparagine synthase (glutamine-hydrolyzing) [Candidatus Peregrinibacteria bacterium]
MCGIAGIIGTEARNRVLLDAMRDTLTHRGPDSSGTVQLPRVALAARRLKILDLESGNQPIRNEDGTVTVVFNGEIYNHKALREELSVAGHRFQTRTDTEVLVHGYEQWGIAGLLERIVGMFAFALYDHSSNRVYLARDRAGEKPLFYYAEGMQFAFSSELQSLLRCPFIARAVDPVSLSHYLALHYVPSPRTMIRNVHKLVPGHYLTVNPATCSYHDTCYWSLSAQSDRDTYAIATERVRSLITQSVESCLQADVPVGIFLSGGIDSSILTGIAAQKMGSVSTFSIGFPESTFDESPLAHQVADAFSTRHSHFVFSELDALAALAPVIAAMDEPCGDQAMLPTYLLAKEASRSVKVVLSGEGADELFGGYDYYPRARAPFSLERLFRRRPSPQSFLGEITTTSGFPLLTEKVMRSALMTEEFRQELEGGTADFSRTEGALAQFRDPLTRAQATDFLTWLPDDLLLKVDRMTMAASIEGRAPYLDWHLIEYAINLPHRYKARATLSKVILREAFRDLLPQNIRERPKYAFRLPVTHWLRTALREELLGSSAVVQEDGIDASAFRSLIDRHLAGEDHARLLYAIMVYRRWFERVRALPATPSIVFDRDTLSTLFIQGKGIEIGALHHPLPVSPKATVHYVDRFSVPGLRQHYPELSAEQLVPVSIVDDGETLSTIPDGSQDFVIANHFLEHCEDPIGTLLQFFRVLRHHGHLYLSIPEKRFCSFDCKRPVTPLLHLIDDHLKGPEHSREAHYREWVNHTSPQASTAEKVQIAHSLAQAGYSIHFHVWTQEEMFELLRLLRAFVDFEIEAFLRNVNECVFVLVKGKLVDEEMRISWQSERNAFKQRIIAQLVHRL